MRGLAGLALLALSLGAIPLGRAQAPSMAGGVVYPAPEYAYWNPAFSALPAEDRGRGFSLPVGLLRLLPLFPDTSPLAYLTNPEAFRDRFDLLGFYAVLQNPYLFLLAPPRSPREVVFRLSGSRFSIEDAEGRPLALLEPGRGGEGQPLLLGRGAVHRHRFRSGQGGIAEVEEEVRGIDLQAEDGGDVDRYGVAVRGLGQGQTRHKGDQSQ